MPHDFEQLVLSKLDKIENTQVEHTVQLALNTSVLSEHHKRTTLLEDRVEPIEDNLNFIMKLVKLIAGIFAVIGTVAGIVSLFFK